MTTRAPIKLRDLRAQAKIRLSEIVSRAREIDPEFPTTHVSYLGIEETGTRDYWKIKALGQIFGVSMEEMALILKPAPRQK